MPGSFPDDSIDAIEPDTVQPVEKNVSFQAPFEVDPKLAKSDTILAHHQSRKRSRSSPGTLRERKTWPISILPRYEVSHQRQEKKNSQKSNNIIIAVFGQTGSGKSSFISKLTGLPVEIGHGLQSCTSAIEEIDCKIGPYNVTFVDTPGFDDTDMNDTEILQMIATWMKDSYDGNTRLTGVIYLHRITDVRMSGTSVKNIRMLRSLCGTKSLDHVILTTGRWDEVDYYDGVRREGELLTEGKFWGDLVQHGAMIRRYNNTQSGAQAIVDQLLCLSPTVLKIQDEFAVKKKALIDTEAGQSISEALKELTRKHDKELARMKEDLATAMKEKDKQWLKELETRQRELTERIEKTEGNKKALSRPINRKPWFRRSWRCGKCGVRLCVTNNSWRSRINGKCTGCGMAQIFERGGFLHWG